MIHVCIVGAAGRMGRRLIALLSESDDMRLTGALESKNSAFIGQDAGLVAGVKSSGVAITDNLKNAIEGADVMIDFSTGDVVSNAKIATAHDVACVIGSTGLNDEAKVELARLAESGGKIVYATNMSVGINILFGLCRELAEILGSEYDIEVVEMHHRNKKDAPSGTALSLAEALCEGRKLSLQDCRFGRKGLTGTRTNTEIGIHALRGGDVVGEHTVVFATEGERIEISHKASNRDAFAKGALRAARFLMTASAGLYNMQKVLGIERKK